MIARFSLLALAGALAAAASPAAAQLASGSPGYQFLDAVKNDKASDVEATLAKPGSRIIDTQDPSTGEGALHIVVRRDDSRDVSTLLPHDCTTGTAASIIAASSILERIA